MEVSIFSAAELPAELKGQLLAAIRIEWSWVFSGRNREWDYTQKTTAPCYVLLTHNGQLVSFAEINRRTVRYAGQDLHLGGLSAVYTFPAWRGAGYAAQVVRTATQRLRSDLLDLALLFCLPELAAWYEELEWQIVDPLRVVWGDPGNPCGLSDEVVLALPISALGLRVVADRAPLYVGHHTW